MERRFRSTHPHMFPPPKRPASIRTLLLEHVTPVPFGVLVLKPGAAHLLPELMSPPPERIVPAVRRSHPNSAIGLKSTLFA